MRLVGQVSKGPIRKESGAHRVDKLSYEGGPEGSNGRASHVDAVESGFPGNIGRLKHK